MRVLVIARIVYAPGHPEADSLIIESGRIDWIGQSSAVEHLGLTFDHVVDVKEHFVAPAFVDSHVHLSATGALINGLDLRTATSAASAIEMLANFVKVSPDSFIVGHGWEDTNWPDADKWTHESVASIIGNRHLYLSRIDVHSALVYIPGHRGVVFKDEHHAVRKFVQDELPANQRRAQIQAALDLAASQGVVSVHENGGPAVSGIGDFKDVLDIAAQKNNPEVFAYWGSTDLAEVIELGAAGAAGDLTIDGSIGSRTALLGECYCDSDSMGTQFLDVEQIRDHFIACTNAGIQGGFHAIGDRALENVVAGLKLAEQVVGADAIRSTRHRIEHAEMLNAKHLDYLAGLGIVLSMQPVFDELWGNPGGLYDQRLGTQRSAKMNTFAEIATAGITMAFSSDSPVTPIDPWRSVKAAMNHHTSVHQISARAAFTAHTRGGWRAAGIDDAGTLAEGAPAHLAIWKVDEYSVKVPDDRVRAWSTDVRSGTAPLPDLSVKAPECLATIKSGIAIYNPLNIWPND